VTQREFALEVVERLRAAGHEALWAGGCVRDQLLGREPKDYDVATSALPGEDRQLFGERRTLAIGAAFGVISLKARKPLTPIDVVTFRSDGDYRDGRRPESVAFTDARHDAQRRDFTINGLFFDPVEGCVVDYVGGQADLAARVLRAIGEPAQRFAEDKLRLLRAVRFAATLDFTIEPATMDAIRAMADQVTTVSGERIGAELRRILTHERPRRGVELLADSGLLGALLPEVAARARENNRWWLETLDRMERLPGPTLPAALAALAHDGVGYLDLRAIARRLRLSNKEADRAMWLQQQMFFMAAAAAAPWPRLQRVLAHPGAAELLALAEASLPPDDAGLARCRAKLAEPQDEWNPPPLVTGDDLVAHGFKSGRHFSQLLEHLRDLQLEGRLTTREEALAEAKRCRRS
jgi:tRNA nucleotidyltransferase/poly(A) polymerase